MKFNIEILRKNLPEYLHTLQIEYFEKIDSTNTYLLKRKKFDNEILVITDFQTAGRGRFSRSWISNPAENLMFSIGLPSIKVSDLSKLSFLVPLSIQESIAEVLELNLFIKWPNDLIIDNKTINIIV
jgi:BirA family biotin operon repressor/biotin-[acetyl-CoA-carboxylase] ligase